MVKVLPDECLSLVDMKTAEQAEKRVEAVVEDTSIKQVLRQQQAVVLPQAEREIEDVLLDVPMREMPFVPSGIDPFSHSIIL